MIDLFELVLQGLITLVFAAIGSYVMWKIAGPGVVVKAIRDRMGPILVEWFMTPQIKTGRMKKTVDDEGEESEKEEILSPLQLIMKEAGDLVYQKFMGKLGGDARKRQAVQGDIIDGLSNPANPLGSLLGSVNPRLLDRALKDGDYVPIILEQLGPLAKQFLEKRLNASDSIRNQGGMM